MEVSDVLEEKTEESHGTHEHTSFVSSDTHQHIFCHRQRNRLDILCTRSRTHQRGTEGLRILRWGSTAGHGPHTRWDPDFHITVRYSFRGTCTPSAQTGLHFGWNWQDPTRRRCHCSCSRTNGLWESRYWKHFLRPQRQKSSWTEIRREARPLIGRCSSRSQYHTQQALRIIVEYEMLLLWLAQKWTKDPPLGSDQIWQSILPDQTKHSAT